MSSSAELLPAIGPPVTAGLSRTQVLHYRVDAIRAALTDSALRSEVRAVLMTNLELAEAALSDMSPATPPWARD